MAQIGLRHYKYSKLSSDNKYSGASVLAGAIEGKMSPNIAEAELYADDTLKESAKEYTKGTLTLTVDEDDDKVFAPLLGHYVDEETGEVIRAKDDIAPYVGFGRVIVKIVKNVKKYKAEFFPKVQFKPFFPDAKTKGESIEFSTPSIEGTVYTITETVGGIQKEIWERHNTFDTDEEAQAYLDNLMKAPTEGQGSDS